MLGSSEGLTELDLESWGAVVFVSTFRGAKHLVGQFPLETTEMVAGPPDSFVRLAAAIQNALENPTESSAAPPGAAAAQPRQPRGSPPLPLAAEAPTESDS